MDQQFIQQQRQIQQHRFNRREIPNELKTILITVINKLDKITCIDILRTLQNKHIFYVTTDGRITRENWTSIYLSNMYGDDLCDDGYIYHITYNNRFSDENDQDKLSFRLITLLPIDLLHKLLINYINTMRKLIIFYTTLSSKNVANISNLDFILKKNKVILPFSHRQKQKLFL